MFPNNLFLSITYKRRSVQLAQIKRATSALMNLTLNIFWLGSLPVSPANPAKSVLCIVGGTAERKKTICMRGSCYLCLIVALPLYLKRCHMLHFQTGSATIIAESYRTIKETQRPFLYQSDLFFCILLGVLTP